MSKNTIIIAISVFVLLLVSGIWFLLPANAARVLNFSDSLSNPNTNQPSNHSIIFTTQNSIDPGETLTLSFSPGFDIGNIKYTDIDLQDNGSDITLSGSPSGSTWGVSTTSDTIIFTAGTAAIATNSEITILVGNNASFQTAGTNRISNPSSSGAYQIYIGGNFGGSGGASVFITENNSVSVSAIVTNAPHAIIQWAIPELRSGLAGTNNDMKFFIKVASSDDSDSLIYYHQPYIATTSFSGDYTDSILMSGVIPGTYDVSIKTDQHLSKKLNNLLLTGGLNILNFSQADNSPILGSVRLLAGDINGGTFSSTNPGDNVVNSVDLPILLVELDNTDPDGNQIRANLNQDTVVNSVDLSIMLKNLDMQGEE